MPDWCSTTCAVIGPDDEIERFRQVCLVDYSIDFARIPRLDGTRWCARFSSYCIEDGRHILRISTANGHPVDVLEKFVALFPALSFDVRLRIESESESWFFREGTISAAGTDLHEKATKDPKDRLKIFKSVDGWVVGDPDHPEACNDRGGTIVVASGFETEQDARHWVKHWQIASREGGYHGGCFALP